jgi:hypothetical protein
VAGDAEALGQQPAAVEPATGSAAVPALVAPPNEPFYVKSIAGNRLWQGEILENLPQARLALVSVESEELVVETNPHAFVIVLSQDCDLESDFRRDASGGMILPNVLFCDAFEAEELRSKVKDNENLASKDWRLIKENKNERFQFLHAVKPEDDLKGAGLPELAIDFRLYFTVRTEEVYRRIDHGTVRRCRLSTPYVEHLADRFSHYLARVALPQDH